jgi:hypothetical protein
MKPPALIGNRGDENMTGSVVHDSTGKYQGFGAGRAMGKLQRSIGEIIYIVVRY